MRAVGANRHCEPTGRANARPMTGSAKQSIAPRKERMDCFVALLLAMTLIERPAQRCHTLRIRDIQYAAASRFHRRRLWNAESSAFADDDDRRYGAIECISYSFAIPRREAPELLDKPFPLITEGAGTAGCTLHPRSRVQDCAKKRTRAYRFSGGNPAFPAQWLYGLCRALPGDEFVLSPSSAA